MQLFCKNSLRRLNFATKKVKDDFPTVFHTFDKNGKCSIGISLMATSMKLLDHFQCL